MTEGELVNTFKAMVEKMFNGAATAKGALVITPSKVIVTTPGADNKNVPFYVKHGFSVMENGAAIQICNSVTD